MYWKKEKIEGMLAQVEEIISRALAAKELYRPMLEKVHPNSQAAARNLIYYRAMRQEDIRNLQKQLGRMGLSRLAKAESHVLSSLYTTRSILSSIIKDEPVHFQRAGLSIREGNRLLKTNAKALLGPRSKGRRTRIMVTLPSVAANDYQLVKALLAKGMNCARINCAHDGPEEWEQMAAHVRKASKELKRSCKIAMDLGGPKVRTGPLVEGPRIRKYRLMKNNRGQIIQPLKVHLAPYEGDDPSIPHIPIIASDLSKLSEGQTLYFRDTRHKKRRLEILSVDEEGARGHLFKTTYLETGMPLFTNKKYSKKPIKVGALPCQEAPILLKAGDELFLHDTSRNGRPAQYDKNGDLLEIAHIGCTASELFTQVEIGEPILFDDGQIKGEILEATEEGLKIKIVHTKEGGGKLKPDKGINLPESKLTIRGLTQKDKGDLDYLVKYADVVNLSFVNSAQDVQDLIDELDRLGVRNEMGVILKIETQQGFNNLLEILLTAMQLYPVGVMIARGDLAIECGWENIGRIQEEILSLCQSAHLPDIWATQVLENLAKRGIPSRAEITDAVMAQRAECVMLNKGDYILSAIELLGSILKDMEPYQEKNAPLLPAMKAF